MIFISKEQALVLHAELIRLFGGSPGLRDEGMLDAALATPVRTFDGRPLYPTIAHKAARLAFGLVANHPFVDGNKRLGVHVMLVTLALNDIQIEADDAELVALGLSLAKGAISASALAEWIRARGVA